MVYLGEQPAVAQLPVAQNLRQIQQGRRRLRPRSGGGLEHLAPRLVAHPVYENGVYLVGMLAPLHERGEARVFEQLRLADHRKQRLPLPFGGHRERYVAVLAGQNGYGIAPIRALVFPSRAVPAANQAVVGVHDCGELMQRRERLYLARLHAPAAPVGVALPQRQQRAREAVKPRQMLRLSAGNHQRLAVFVSGQIQKPAEREAYERRRLPVPIGSRKPERGERNVYNAVRERVRAETLAVGGAPVFYQNVGVRDQPPERVRAFGRSPVERRAPLAHVEIEKRRARFGRRRVGDARLFSARPVAERRALYLHHVRAERGEKAPAEGPRHALGDFHHAQPGERRAAVRAPATHRAARP